MPKSGVGESYSRPIFSIRRNLTLIAVWPTIGSAYNGLFNESLQGKTSHSHSQRTSGQTRILLRSCNLHSLCSQYWWFPRQVLVSLCQSCKGQMQSFQEILLFFSNIFPQNSFGNWYFSGFLQTGLYMPFCRTRKQFEKRKLTLHKQFLASHSYFCKYTLLSFVILESVCLCLSLFSFVRTGCTWLDIWPRFDIWPR